MDLKGAKIRNIYRLCTDINKEDTSPLRINIPHYQRPYKWGNEKIKLLINDFFENYEKVKSREENKNLEEQKKYFAGSIVTVKKNDQFHDLIDGQQRITTVFLVNYIKFLLLRSYIYELIYQENKLNIKEAFNNMIKAADNFYKNGKSEIEEIKTEVINRMGKISNDDEKEYKNLLKYYKRGVGLPIENLDDPDYLKSYKNDLKQFLEGKEFCLKYSRSSFNNKLKKALAHVKIELTSQSGPSSRIINEKSIKEDNTVKQYIEAMETIFYAFEDFVDEKKLNPLEKNKKLIKNKIDNFLQYLNFCLIQTGNTNDAYTLFEVLNDRALELDDLDLIKNMFYKEYCERNLSKSENTIDKNIEKLEELWGDEIFSQNTPEWKKKLVAFLGTVFLTGDISISHNSKEKYRESIKKYLNEQYSENKKNSKYNFKNIKNEFKIFQFIKIIINEYDLPYQNKSQSSLQAENDVDVSITYKTLHLLNALKHFGVMPPLINIILKTYIEEYNDDFNESNFKKYLKDIKNDNSHNNSKLKKIHKYAHNLWRLAMLSKDYKLPREFAKEGITKINYNKFETSLNIDIDKFDDAKDEFKEWITRWYKGNKNDFRIKVLFINLLKCDKNDGKIIYTNNTPKFKNVENLELDHFEPKKPVEDNQKKYFVPDNIGEDRDNYIDQLGNFMLLEKGDNTKLSNKPADKSFEYYQNTGLGNHWVINDLNKTLDEHSKKVDDVRVPTKGFFNERKNRLKNYFFTIIEKGLNENRIDIKPI